MSPGATRVYYLISGPRRTTKYDHMRHILKTLKLKTALIPHPTLFRHKEPVYRIQARVAGNFFAIHALSADFIVPLATYIRYHRAQIRKCPAESFQFNVYRSYHMVPKDRDFYDFLGTPFYHEHVVHIIPSYKRYKGF